MDVPGTIFGHGTHLSDADIAVVNETATISLAHNPNSNMNNGVGYTPVAKFARLPQLGTDGIGADMWREARTAEFKSHDAGLPIPFGASLQMLGQSARFASKCLGVKLGVLEAWRRGRFGFDELSARDADDCREFGRPLSVCDGSGVRARRDDRRLVGHAKGAFRHLR